MNTRETAILITNPEDLDSLTYNEYFTFNCKKCNKIVITRFRRYKIEKLKRLLCPSCAEKATNLEIHGDPNYNNMDQNYKTKFKNHDGDKYYNNREKFKMTWNNKSDEERNRISNNMKKVWENMPIEKKNIFKQKCSERLLSKSKEEWNEIISKRVNTLKSLPQEEKDRRANNFRKTMKKKTPEEMAKINEKIKKSRMKSTGHPYPISKRCYYYGMFFDSMWELAVWIYYTDHNVNIIKSPCLLKYWGRNGNAHEYIPDFMIDGKLIEVKGDQYFNPDGTMRYPYTKKKMRGKWVDLDPEEKSYYDDLYERKHQCGLSHGVEFWKGSDCRKYIEYCNLNHPGWQVFFRRDNPLNPSYWCSNILNPGYYQRQDFIPLVQSATPYAKPDSDGYVFSDTETVTPFDIK